MKGSSPGQKYNYGLELVHFGLKKDMNIDYYFSLNYSSIDVTLLGREKKTLGSGILIAIHKNMHFSSIQSISRCY